MTSKCIEYRYGAKPVESRRTGVVPGPSGPPQRSGGTLPLTWGTRSGGSRLHASGTRVPQENQKPVRLLQWNAEGISKKKLALTQKLYKDKIDVACIQETHLTERMRFSIRGYQCHRQDRQEHKGGILMLIKNDYPFSEVNLSCRDTQSSEIQGISVTIKGEDFKIYNYYSPQTKPLDLDRIQIESPRCLVLGDFNSHSPSWGYETLDKRGEEVENWMLENNLQILYEEDDEDTFFSRAWRTTSNPDLSFITEEIDYRAKRKVEPQLAGSDHKPISITIHSQEQTKKKIILPRWNYKKANWIKYIKLSDQYTRSINCRSKNVDQKAKEFTEALLKAAKESIPRGARRDYIPLWTAELDDLNQQISEARTRVENDPTNENMDAYKKAEDDFKRKSTDTAREAWKEKTEKLDMDRNANKLWGLVKTLNREPNSFAPPVLKSEHGTRHSLKQTANIFLRHFKNVGNIDVDKYQAREVKRELNKWRKEKSDSHEIMERRLLKEELYDALKTLSPNKSPGPDGISNEMLTHLGERSRRKLLQLFNKTWKIGKIPNKWKEATMIPIKKDGKPPNKPESYRPISLTSCLCKLQERIINKRLLWYLESHHLIIDEQAGFRKSRSTEDQIVYITQQIEDSFQEGNKTAVVWVDMEKAFDKVWRDGLLLKLKALNIKQNMFRWIENYLDRRKARVEVQGIRSRQATIKHGVPQGGVLSPTLFIMFMNDIKETLCRQVKISMYADDLALISSAKKVRAAQERLQITLDGLEQWTKKWYMNINAQKTTHTIFSLSPKTETMHLKIGNHTLVNDQAPKYLGVHFDTRLTWKNHIQECQKMGLRRSKVMSKLAGTTWGANMQILKQTYEGFVRPKLEYGMAAWGICSNIQLDKINKIQNQNLRRITGGIKSTPIIKMEELTGTVSLDVRRNEKILNQYCKMKTNPKQPLYEKTKTKPKARLKRTNFLDTSIKLEKKYDMTEVQIEMKETADFMPWDKHKMPTIGTDIKGLNSTINNKETNREVASNFIERNFPKSSWTRIYTDGTATKTGEIGGAGIFIEFPNGQNREHFVPAGLCCTNYKAEALAISEGAKMITDWNTSIYAAKIVILTDSKEILETLLNPKSTELKQLKADLISLNEGATDLMLQWIPGHCGILGNERADQLAKMGAQQPQHQNKYNFDEMKSLIKSKTRTVWRKQHPNFSKYDPIKQLNRQEQVTIFRLRCGHNRLQYHLYKTFKIGETGNCECGGGHRDATHILQECALYNTQRSATWPEAAPLQSKLYGSLQELRRTTGFLRSIDVHP